MELETLPTRWDSSNSLSLPTRVGIDEATPMEVGYIRGDKGKKGGTGKTKDQKGKSKGKEKGKSKTDGTCSWRSGDKGKSQWETGGFGKKGKASDKGWPFRQGMLGTEASPREPGRRAIACLPGGASSSSGQGGQTVTTSSVKMVRLETPPESRSLEIFDLTTPRKSGESPTPPWRVGMIQFELVEDEFKDMQEELKEDEEFMDCIEPVVDPFQPIGQKLSSKDLSTESTAGEPGSHHFLHATYERAQGAPLR